MITISSKELDQMGWHIRHHHEAFDGSGFPDGPAGEEISLGGRIIHLDSSGSLFMGQGTRLTPEHLRTIRSRQHMDLPISMVSIRRSTC